MQVEVILTYKEWHSQACVARFQSKLGLCFVIDSMLKGNFETLLAVK